MDALLDHLVASLTDDLDLRERPEGLDLVKRDRCTLKRPEFAPLSDDRRSPEPEPIENGLEDTSVLDREIHSSRALSRVPASLAPL